MKSQGRSLVSKYRPDSRDTPKRSFIQSQKKRTFFSALILAKLKFIRQHFVKNSYIGFHENPSDGSVRNVTLQRDGRV